MTPGDISNHDELVVGEQLIADADRTAELVERGIPAHLVIDRVRLTSWGAEASPGPRSRSTRHCARSAACLMYLGQNVRREALPQSAPRALSADEQRLLLRAAERAGER